MSTITAPTKDAPGKKGNLVEMNWDPITRIVGSLGIFTKIDFDNKHVVECHSTSSIFRGYSIFMKGKDPRDAHFITSRICGICGDNHATCATYAQNMAFGVKPPPIAEWIVNLGEAAEYMFDHNIFQDNLVGVDFCEQMVKETNPKVWAKAQSTAAPHASAHGYRTIADIMTALNPFTGAFYREALVMSRMTREMFCLMEGRHVHPSTLYPGGVGTVPTVQLFTDYLVRLMKYVEFMKKVVPLHDDLVRLLLRRASRLRGSRPAAGAAGLLGIIQRSRRLRLHLQEHDELGPRHVRHPGNRGGRQTGDDRPGGHQSEYPHPAGQFLLRRVEELANLRQDRSAGESGGQEPSLEPDHDSAAAEARFRRQVHLGDVAALVRQAHRRSSGAWTPEAARSLACGRRLWPGWWISDTSRPPAAA